MNEQPNEQTSPMDDFMTRMRYFGLRPKVALLTDNDSSANLKSLLDPVCQKLDIRLFRVHWDRDREIITMLSTLDSSDCDVVVLTSLQPLPCAIDSDELLASFARMKTVKVTALGGASPKLEQCADIDLQAADKVVEALSALASSDAVRRPEYMSPSDHSAETLLEREINNRVETMRTSFETEKATLADLLKQQIDQSAQLRSQLESQQESEQLKDKKLHRRAVTIVLFVILLVALAAFLLCIALGYVPQEMIQIG